MYRSWGFQTLTGNAQYLFQDKITAAMAVPPDGQDATLVVGDTTKYQDGDRITLDPGQADADTVLVSRIISATKLQVSSQGAPLHAHANNTVICLDLVCGQLLIQLLTGSAGSLYIGADSTVTNTGGGSAFVALAAGGSYNLGQAQWNPLRTTDVVIAGTLNDKVGIGAFVV